MRLLIVVLFVVSVALPASAQQRVALLIGNQDYKPGVGKLVNPFNDIKLVGEALRAVGFDVLKPVKNATRADIFEALDAYTARLSKAGAGAIGFVYYSGHGIASKGANYLIPVDVAKPSSRLLRADGVKHSEVLEILRQDAPKAAHYLVVDACRNELQGARGGKGFVAVKEQSGVLIAFATSPDKTATDVGDGGGPYAKALAAELVQPGVTDLQMFSNVRYAVSRATGGDQVPWTLDGIVRRDRVMFAGAAATTPSMANLKQRLIRKLEGQVTKEFPKFRLDPTNVREFRFDKRGTPAFAVSYTDAYHCGSGGCGGDVYVFRKGTFTSVFDSFGITNLAPSGQWRGNHQNLESIEYAVGRQPVYGVYTWTGKAYQLDRLEFCLVFRQQCKAAQEASPQYKYVIDMIDSQRARRALNNIALEKIDWRKVKLYETPGADSKTIDDDSLSGTLIGKVRNGDWYLVHVWKGNAGFAAAGDLRRAVRR